MSKRWKKTILLIKRLSSLCVTFLKISFQVAALYQQRNLSSTLTERQKKNWKHCDFWHLKNDSFDGKISEQNSTKNQI